MIGVAQVFVVFALLGCLLQYFFKIDDDNGDEKGPKVKFRASSIALLCLIFFCVLSVFVNWNSYESPLRESQKIAI